MADARDHEGLQIDSDVALQERMWLVERSAWGVFALLVAAALLGAFGGSGPLSRGSFQEPGAPFSLQYQRLARHSTETSLSFRVMPRRSEADLWLDNRYLEAVTVERISPEPLEIARDTERTLYRFRALTPDRPLDVAFQVRPTGYGPLDLVVGTVDRPPVRLRIFVYP